MSRSCHCTQLSHDPTFVVLTGGPGAGKTAVLEIVRKNFCAHVAVLPEAAGIVYGGGFPRRPDTIARKAAQRGMFHIQRELERMSIEEQKYAVILCDRGTIDGLAYWPDEPDELWRDVGTSLELELARYGTVIHLRTPAPTRYNHHNPLRLETPEEAAQIDDKIARAWDNHPRRVFVPSTDMFLDKARAAIAIIEEQIPACCRISASAPPPDYSPHSPS
jgi:predicted ATPase